MESLPANGRKILKIPECKRLLPGRIYYAFYLVPEIMKQNIYIETISFLLILLFVYAAITKLSDYTSFRQQIVRSPYISFFSDLAWSLPTAELITALLLAFKPLRLAGLLASFFLMLVFTLYVGIILLGGHHLPCSCGGVLKNMTWKQHLLFNTFFLLLSALGSFLKTNDIQPKKNIVI